MQQVQPRSAFLLIFTQSWESFSFFGMRVLLVLYLISQLQFADHHAYATYALYITLIELGAFVGGYTADKFLGLRQAVMLGGGFILFGHLCIACSTGELPLFVGIGAIVSGASLFRANLKALLGLQYSQSTVSPDSGFTLLHTGMNAGAFSAALLCGYVAERYGWHLGFGIAALGMLLAMVVFCLASAHVQDIRPHRSTKHGAAVAIIAIAVTFGIGCLLLYGTALIRCVQLATLVAFFGMLFPISRRLDAQKARTLFYLLGLLIVFFTFEQLNGSFMMVFCERHVDKTVAGFQIPTATLAAANPFAIILFGPFLARFVARTGPSMSMRLGASFLFLGASFAILYAAGVGDRIPAAAVACSFAAVGLGELFIAPTVYAFCTENAPQASRGTMMGLVTMAMAIANLCSGELSKFAGSLPEEVLPQLFLASAIFCGAVFIVVKSLRYVQNTSKV